MSQFAQNVVEALQVEMITGSNDLLGFWFKKKFPEIWLNFYGCLPINKTKGQNIVLNCSTRPWKV